MRSERAYRTGFLTQRAVTGSMQVRVLLPAPIILQAVELRSNPLSLNTQFDSGLEFQSGTRVGSSVIEHSAFNRGVVGLIPTRRTSRVKKRELVTQLAGYQTLNLDCGGSNPPELTIGSVVQLAGSSAPTRGIRVRILTDPPVERLWRAGIAQLVERVSRKHQAAGSTPASSSNAGVAQQAEPLPCKQRVASSILAAGPKLLWGRLLAPGYWVCTPVTRVGISPPPPQPCGPIAQLEERLAEAQEIEVRFLFGPPRGNVTQWFE